MLGFGKKKFDTTLLKPTGGLISGIWFSNPHVGIETSLLFKIEIDLTPFEYAEEKEETSLRFELIDFPVTSYRELANRSFSYPINPTEGYIDGSVYISNMHNPFDVTRISFGAVENDVIEAEFNALLSFEDDSVKPTDITMSTKLKFGDVMIYCDKLSAMSPDELQEFTKDKLDRNDFQYDYKDKIFKYTRQPID